MTSKDTFEIRSSWPGTTIRGDPGIVSGVLGLSFESDGSAVLNLAVGLAGAPSEECDYVEFALSPDQVGALARTLAAKRG